MQREPTMPLILTVTGDRSAYRLHAPIPLTVTLRNASDLPLLINARMGVGYEDGIVRELFFTIYAPDGRIVPVSDEARTDAHRMPPGKDDFSELGPGSAMAAVVDLAQWYSFSSAGTYSVVFTYENVWDGSDAGVDAWTGRVSSMPLSLVIG